MKIRLLVAAAVLGLVPACAQAQTVAGLIGDVVGGAVGTADTAVNDVVGGPRRGYYRSHRYHRAPGCIYRHGHRYCR